jgi:hypothetical protein
LLEDPSRNLSVIMKNGEVVKNELVRNTAGR